MCQVPKWPAFIAGCYWDPAARERSLLVRLIAADEHRRFSHVGELPLS